MITPMIGGPLSGLLMKAHWFGWSGWRWLLILEGVPAVLLGTAAWFYLTDLPKEARWLSDEAKNWLAGELERERLSKTATEHMTVGEALRNRDVILLTFSQFMIASASTGLVIWLPKILHRLSG